MADAHYQPFNDDPRYPVAKQAYLLIGFHPGSDLLGAAAEARAFAHRFGEAAGGMFSGELLLARPTDSVDEVVRRFERRINQPSPAWRPELDLGQTP